jgi:hypothetical protein
VLLPLVPHPLLVHLPPASTTASTPSSAPTTVPTAATVPSVVAHTQPLRKSYAAAVVDGVTAAAPGTTPPTGTHTSSVGVITPEGNNAPPTPLSPIDMLLDAANATAAFPPSGTQGVLPAFNPTPASSDPPASTGSQAADELFATTLFPGVDDPKEESLYSSFPTDTEFNDYVLVGEEDGYEKDTVPSTPLEVVPRDPPSSVDQEDDDVVVVYHSEQKKDDLTHAVNHANSAGLTDGAKFAMGTTNHTKKYTTRKKQLLVEFVNVLKKHRGKYERFLVKISEVPPSFPTNEPVEAVFILLRGEENKSEKIRSLNGMLIDWVEGKRLKVAQKSGHAYPAPSSINTMIRTFLAATKDYYQWSFVQKDFGYDGGYNGYFRTLIEKRRREDVSFDYDFFTFFQIN